MRLRLGSDLSLVTAWDTVNMLEPLSEAVRAHTEREPRRAAQTARYMEVGPQLFELSPLDDCDIAVLPFAWEDTGTSDSARQHARSFFEQAAGLGRTTLVFSHDDRPTAVDAPNVISFHRSLHRSSRRPWEFGLPAWIADPVGDELVELTTRPFRTPPSISFCGYAPPLGIPMSPLASALWRWRDGYRRLRTTAGMDERRGFSPPLFYRADALRVLQRSADVVTDFIFRPVGSVHTDPRGYRSADDSMSAEQFRREYFRNIVGNDYVLAVRGLGNYSVRFYEALACGRIPLFVDTDCVLPPLRGWGWDEAVVRVGAGDVRRIGRQLSEAHRCMGGDGFLQRQEVGRRLWLEQLEMAGFFRTLHAVLADVLSQGPLIGEGGRDRLCRALRANETSWDR